MEWLKFVTFSFDYWDEKYEKREREKEWKKRKSLLCVDGWMEWISVDVREHLVWLNGVELSCKMKIASNQMNIFMNARKNTLLCLCDAQNEAF